MSKDANHKNWQVPKHSTYLFYKKKAKYCVVIPVHSEGERIKKQLAKMIKFSKLVDIFISDAGVGELDFKAFKKFGLRGVLVNNSATKGQSNQLKIGLSFALKEGYKGVITMDGNNKDNPSAIPRFVKALDQGYDYVQGSRFIKGGKHKNTPTDRVFFNRLVISPILSLVSRKWYTDTPNNFRCYSKKYLTHPKVLPFRNIFQRYELLFYLVIRANLLGLKSKEIPVTRGYPKGKAPTKIVGLQKVGDLIQIFRISLGFYNP